MGVVLTAFVNGAVMSATAVNTNLLLVRNWLNGGIAAGDIVAETIPTRAFRRMDHFFSLDIENRMPQLDRSIGVTGTTTRGTQTSNPTSRAYACVDSHGISNWEEVSTLGTIMMCKDAGWFDIVYEWWCWATQGDQATPEAIPAADFRLTVNGVGVASTVHSLRLAGIDPVGSSDGGPFNYPARNFQAVWQEQIGAGWNAVQLQVSIADRTTNRTQYGLVIVGARNRHVEYWRK